MPKKQAPDRQLTLELRAAEVSKASFAPTPFGEGGLLAFSVGPLPDETIVALEKAAEAHTPVRFLFAEHLLLLELVNLERKEAQRIRIVGQIVERSAATAE